jgi:hypothetical protein
MPLKLARRQICRLLGTVVSENLTAFSLRMKPLDFVACTPSSSASHQAATSCDSTALLN